MSSRMLVRQRRGETAEEARARAERANPGVKSIVEMTVEGSSINRDAKEFENILNQYADDKFVVYKSVNLIRKTWGVKIEKAKEQVSLSKNISVEMSSTNDLMSKVSATRLMTVSEQVLGAAYGEEGSKWVLNKHYDVISNLDYSDWSRGSSAGVDVTDVADFGECEKVTYVQIDYGVFSEAKRLDKAFGGMVEQDIPEADKLAIAKLVKFPKSKDALSATQRRAVNSTLKTTEMGQNHLTRLVRGILLSLAAEMRGDNILLEYDANSMEAAEYEPKTLEKVFEDPDASAIWCGIPQWLAYAAILPHLCLEWGSEDIPSRIRNIVIPSDSAKVYVISMGPTKLSSVRMSAKEIRWAVVTYAQSVSCEERLAEAYCIASMMLQHELWPAIHLPASMCACDLVWPAVQTRNHILRHKRVWNLREAKVVSKYAVDALGLAIKELVSSGWDRNAIGFEDMVRKVSSGSLDDRNKMYSWLTENIIGEAAGYIFKLDPIGNPNLERIRGINNTGMLYYWYLNQVKMVGGNSLCSTMMCGEYTAIPSTNTDTASARELALLRQLGVVVSGSLFDREVRVKKLVLDQAKKDLIDGSLREGLVSIVPSGISTVNERKRKHRAPLSK